jgi:hypothetical protein
VVAEIFLYGFISAFGWWTANHYVIEPHFPDPIEKKVKKDEQDKRDTTTLRCAGKSLGTRDDCGSESSRNADLHSDKGKP